MRCVRSECGEVVAVAGRAPTEIYLEHEEGWVAGPMLYPAALVPAPPLIELPSDTPPIVTRNIEQAFALYWMNLGATTNRLRIAIERMLDDLKIPKERDTKAGTTKRIDLFERIELFKTEAPEHAETFNALRIVGNLGSHEGDVEEAVVLDAFSILEHAVSEIYGRRSQTIDALRKKIIASKGSYIKNSSKT